MKREITKGKKNAPKIENVLPEHQERVRAAINLLFQYILDKSPKLKSRIQKSSQPDSK